jgi:hypothetical protein
MRQLLRWYGANPLHLLALASSFALAGYAADRLVPSNPLGIGIWFLGAVIGHDLVLMPLYTLADRSAAAVLRHRAARLPAMPWINYLRVPAALSGLLFLVWFPLILRLRTRYQASTTLSPDPYLWHWLGVTGALFLISAAVLALRIRRPHRTVTAPEQPPAAGAAADSPGRGPQAGQAPATTPDVHPGDASGPGTGDAPDAPGSQLTPSAPVKLASRPGCPAQAGRVLVSAATGGSCAETGTPYWAFLNSAPVPLAPGSPGISPRTAGSRPATGPFPSEPGWMRTLSAATMASENTEVLVMRPLVITPK